ncbi:MAG: fused MFS/spermidine synthase [Myxococcota bacterium]
MEQTSPPSSEFDFPGPASAHPRERSLMVLPFLPNALAFLASMSIMILELVAGRLVAPTVGSSQYTWTSILCVILAGMSIGNFLGGRVADSPAPMRTLEKLFAGAALSVLAPLLLHEGARQLRPAALSLVLNHPEGSSHLWGFAVLGLMTLVFLLPAIGLGVISPVLARLALDVHKSTGRAIGDVYSWGAVGAILGVLLTGFVLISLLPVVSILLGVAGMMAFLAGVVHLSRPWFERSQARLQALTDAEGAANAAEVAARALISPVNSENSPRLSLMQTLEDKAPAPAPPDREAPLHPYVLIALSSFCLMAIEMVAGRLVSRYVGSSIYTWTLVIGVIFAGMSLGNWLGGLLASRRPWGWSLQRLASRLLLFASLFTFLPVWTAESLDDVLEAQRWTGEGHLYDALFTWPERSQRALRAEGVPEQTLELLRRLPEEAPIYHAVDLNHRLRGRLDPQVVSQHLDAIMREARLTSPTFSALRSAGVPDVVLEGLRPIVNRPMLTDADETLMNLLAKKPLTQLYSAAERRSFRELIYSYGWYHPWLGFPVRLCIALLLVFGPAAILLGCASPVIAALALEHSRARGRTLGNVYAWGAWGSIIGTALSGFFLLRWFGTHLLLGLSAFALALLALGALPLWRSVGPWLAALALLMIPQVAQKLEPNGLDPLSVPHFSTAAQEGMSFLAPLAKLLDEWVKTSNPDLGPNRVDSNYQSVRVTWAGDKHEVPGEELRKLGLDRLIHGYLLLKVPEGLPFTYEQASLAPYHLEYDYEVAYALATARSQLSRFEPDPAKPGNWLPPPLLSLNLGGGTYTFPRHLLAAYGGRTHVVQPGESFSSLLERYYGLPPSPMRAELEARIRAVQPTPMTSDALQPGQRLSLPALGDVVELDPVVTGINYSRLGLKRFEQDPRLKTWNYDARNFVEALVSQGWTGRYDVIFGDAFNHYSVPYHLSTVEFNAGVKKLLKPGGVFVANLIDRYGKSRFLSAYLTTLQALYQHVYVVVDRDRSLHYGRETFVILATDQPVPLSFGGGLPLDNMEAFLEGNFNAAAEGLEEEDRERLTRMRLALEQEGPSFLERVRTFQQVDLQMVGISTDAETLREAEAVVDSGLRIRSFEPLSQAEVELTLIQPGRPETTRRFIRNLLPVRALLGREQAKFQVTPESLQRLRDRGVADKAVRWIATLEGVTFQDGERLLDVLSLGLPPAELARYGHLLLEALREPLPQQPPLVLTDAFAPADELLSQLFEDPTQL